MFYPAELQMRIADLPNHLGDEEWMRNLDHECLVVLREHKHLYGELRPDAYPDVFSTRLVKVQANRGPSPRGSSPVTLTLTSKLSASMRAWYEFFRSWFY
jgi:hypothetical protein